MSTFWQRVVRAAKLDPQLYEEVEADRSALGQAAGVVILSSLAAGVGALEKGGPGWLVLGTVSALVSWGVWAYLTYFIGAKLLPEPQTRSDPGELLRTIGFASAPGLVRVLGFLPGLGRLVYLIASAWMIVAMVIAVRQALDYESTPRAVGVCLIGWVIQAAVLALLATLFGDLGPT